MSETFWASHELLYMEQRYYSQFQKENIYYEADKAML